MDGLPPLERVAVIGAGVMGAGIAAHCANAGAEVLLLDIVPAGAADRDTLAKGAIQRMLKADPAPFMTARAARRVTSGNVEDHLERLAEVDWIVEAVTEDPAVKQALYARIDAVRKPGSVVSSNTSTLPLAVLTDGMGAGLRRDFLVTHFFNPPRYMRLLEAVLGPETDEAQAARVEAFADRRLGKSVVRCLDRPGFIGNRLGAFWLQAAMRFAQELGLTVEEADAVMGRPFGFPKTGVFGLVDLVGLDLIPYVDRSLAARLDCHDAYHRVRADLTLVERLVKEGSTGRKGKGGFYRLAKDAAGARQKEAIALATGEYAPAVRPVIGAIAEGGKEAGAALLRDEGRAGAYARAVLARTLAYAATLVPEVTAEIASVDQAMRLGYNWKEGPFQLMDRLGVAAAAELMRKEGVEVPPLVTAALERGGFYRDGVEGREQLDPARAWRPLRRPEGVLLLEDAKRGKAPVSKNGSAAIWDIGDGVWCFEIRTKLNTIDTEVMKLLAEAVRLVPERGAKALVVYTDAEHFSAGANLGLALFAANVGAWPQIEETVRGGQETYSLLRAAPFPVVAAPAGMALGGACELCLAADAVQAHAESYIGLVEVGVGIIPGWGGCVRLQQRLAADPKRPRGPVAIMAQAFQTIGMAKVSKSAFEAVELGYLAPSDGITMNRERLLHDAKAKALTLAEGYAPPAPQPLAAPGPTGKAAAMLALHDLEEKGLVTPHDQVVTEALADALSGGPDADATLPLSEEAMLQAERTAFFRLVRHPATLARMEHMLDTGKPLRN